MLHIKNMQRIKGVDKMFFFVATMYIWQQIASAWVQAWLAWISQANSMFPRPIESYIKEIDAIWENSESLEEQEMACFRIIGNIPGLPEEFRFQVEEILFFAAGQGYLRKAWKQCTATCGRSYA